MGKKKRWFNFMKRLFFSESKPKSKKSSRSLYALEAPKTTLNDAVEEERGKHAVAIAAAAVAVAEAAIAAADAAAEVARLTNLSHEMRRRNFHLAAMKIQTCYKGYLARKALSALKGVVKLQAVVRGELARRHVVKKLAMISLWELRLQRSMIIQEKKTPATMGTTNLAQLKLRNAIKHAQNVTPRRRSFCNANDKTGDGDYKSIHKAVQIFPAYMATTESAKAKTKARSSSTPKQRRRLSDSFSCRDSPTKLSISSWSSFNSELINHSQRSLVGDGIRRF